MTNETCEEMTEDKWRAWKCINIWLWSLSGHRINPQRLKVQLGLCTYSRWKVIIGICRNLHYKGLALTRPSGDFSQGKTIDWCLVSPWFDFTQSTGITMLELRGPALPNHLSSGLQFVQQHWDNWQETPQLPAGTSWEPEDLYQPLKCLSHSKHYIYYDKFLNRD